MNILEKILEEIKEAKEVSRPQSVTPFVRGIIIGLTTAEEIVRSRMNSGWIPTSERLPDEEGNVLVTVNGTYKSTHFKNAIMLGNYDPDDGDWIIEGLEEWKNPNVTAWMPLPQSYQGE